MLSEKESQLPLYLQLADEIRSDMCEQSEINDKIPSEREICRLYNVSRTTVRQALDQLESNGFIYRIHGKGTFVSPINVNKKNLGDYYSFTEQTKRQGKVPKSVVLEFEIVEANYYLSTQLEINVGDKLIRFVRLRLADDIPMMVEISYIPHDKFFSLTREMLNNKPMYDIFDEDYNSKIISAEETFSAAIINTDDANLLWVKPGDACLKLTRISRDISNRVIEFTTSTARSDQFHYKVFYSHNV